MKIVVEIVTRTEEIHSLRRTDVEPGNRATEQNVWAKYWSGWHQCSEQTVLFGMHLNSADRLGSTPTGLSINDVTNFFDKSWSLYPFVTYKSPVFEMEISRGKNISLYQYNVSSWYFFKARSFSHIWVSKWSFPRRNISGFFDEQISIHFCGWFWAKISQTLFCATLRRGNSVDNFFVQTF